MASYNWIDYHFDSCKFGAIQKRECISIDCNLLISGAAIVSQLYQDLLACTPNIDNRYKWKGCVQLLQKYYCGSRLVGNRSCILMYTAQETTPRYRECYRVVTAVKLLQPCLKQTIFMAWTALWRLDVSLPSPTPIECESTGNFIIWNLRVTSFYRYAVKTGSTCTLTILDER